MPNISVLTNANVTVDTKPVTNATPAANPASGTAKVISTVKTVATVESAHVDEQAIESRTRNEYVKLFRKSEVKTALATLEMCRIVYEAHKTLTVAEYNAFCGDIGYKDTSSTIRKFQAIGRVAPRLVQYADRMPASWTSIYLLTQIPASTFERMVQQGKVFKSIKTSHIQELVEETRDKSRIEDSLVWDKAIKKWKFATAYFTVYKVDDVDWRSMRKAFTEIESRLPIKFQISTDAEHAWAKRKEQIYDEAKAKYKEEALQVEKWDYGREANTVAESTLEPASQQPEEQIAENPVAPDAVH